MLSGVMHWPVLQKTREEKDQQQALALGRVVFKTTGLNPWFQRKNMYQVPRYQAKRPKNQVAKPNMHNFDVLANISGPGAYFSKPIFALKPWVQTGRFEYHTP